MGLDRDRRSRARPHGLLGLGRAHDTEPGHSVAGPARVAGLEVEEALEHGSGTGAVRLALAAVHDDHARSPGPQLVGRARDRRGATALGSVPPGQATRRLRCLGLHRRARRLGPLAAAASAPPATTRAAPAGIVLHHSSLARRAAYHWPEGARS